MGADLEPGPMGSGVRPAESTRVVTSGFSDVTLMADTEPIPGDDRPIDTAVRRGVTTATFKLVSVNPAIAWLMFGLIRPELIHDAAWASEADTL